MGVHGCLSQCPHQVVLDAGYFASKLPTSIEAIYYHQGDTTAARLARNLKRAFDTVFGGGAPAAARRALAPVLVFDLSKWDAPFSEDHEG